MINQQSCQATWADAQKISKKYPICNVKMQEFFSETLNFLKIVEKKITQFKFF